MSGRYLTAMADWLSHAGLTVVEYDGWTTRARSSGGYADGRPWGIMWHHTASNTTPANDADYMCNGSPDRPIANLLIARDGAVWVLAAGCTNTNGKGGPWAWSRGMVPKDAMNTYAVGCEIASDGVGGIYPTVQIDAAFTTSITLGQRLGLADWDLCQHAFYAPQRKIDPATAGAVQGPWQPRSSNSSGTWELDDLIIEHQRRWHDVTIPAPLPPALEEDDMTLLLQCGDGAMAGAIAVAPDDLSRMLFLSSGEDYSALSATGRYSMVTLSAATFERIPGAEQVDVIGDN